MNRTHRRFAAAFALVGAALALPVGADALPAGTAPNGTVTIAPASGTSLTTGSPASSFGLDANMACPGDTTTGGYRWNTFMTSGDVDPATLTFDAAGPTTAAEPAGAFIRPLYTSTGTPVADRTTEDGTGAITSLPSFSFDPLTTALTVIPSGVYTVGYACTLGGETTSYWSASMTLVSDSSGVNWSFGAVPVAPRITAVTPTANQLMVEFASAAIVPAIDSYTVTLTPQLGGAPFSMSGPSSPIVVSGLSDGTTYAVAVTATNALGTSAPTVLYTSTVQGQLSVQQLFAGRGANSGDAVVAWRAPPSPTAPSGYTLTVSPVGASDPIVPGSPFTVPAEVLSYTIPKFPGGDCIGQYLFTVTPTYAAPQSGRPKTVQAYPTPCAGRPDPLPPPPPSGSGGGGGSGGVTATASVGQNAIVTRPVGVLVLTQRCGVNGALPAEPTLDAFPGFPGLAAKPASNDQVGTAPSLDPAGTVSDDAAGQFASYPNPDAPVYPTYCGVNLGAAKFITDLDHLEGQYFAAEGSINQVTVFDTRGIDYGWVAKGAVSDFSAGAGLGADYSFDGNFLGWTPVLNSTSAPIVDGPGSSYYQVVAAGPSVLPGAGIDTDAGLGSSNGQVLGQSIDPSTGVGGLGIAVLDARLKLLIPVTKNGGAYSATMTITVA